MAEENPEAYQSIGIEVVYCPRCGIPPEYCEFREDYEKCIPWIKENFPELIKDDVKNVTEKVKKMAVKDKEPDSKAAKPSGKPEQKAKAQPTVTIRLTARNKKKFITIISGLDAYDLSLKDISKQLSKKFACSASVVKGTLTPELHVQGDVARDVVDFLTEKYTEIPRNKIVIKNETVKKSDPSQGGDTIREEDEDEEDIFDGL